jgi:putative PIN family toxin of toxin-antitoxin system
MNIVLDTNVLVAGLLSPFGPCAEIVRMISSGKLTLSFDARILSEYNQVLRRPKFKFEEDKVAPSLTISSTVDTQWPLHRCPTLCRTLMTHHSWRLPSPVR